MHARSAAPSESNEWRQVGRRPSVSPSPRSSSTASSSPSPRYSSSPASRYPRDQSSSTRPRFEFEVILNRVKSRFNSKMNTGSGIAFEFERLRGFHRQDDAIEYAKGYQSRLSSDDTLYVQATGEKKTCFFYVTSTIAAPPGQGLPTGPRQ